jgi:hypothetical protein
MLNNIGRRAAMRKLFLLGLIEGLAVLTVTSAAAASVTFQFAGVVTAVQDELAVLDGSVGVGTPFSGFYTFESTSADINPEANLGGYVFPAPPGAFRVVVGNYTFETQPGQSYSLQVANSHPLDGRDRYSVGAGPIGVLGPIDPLVGMITTVRLGLSALPPGPLTSDQLLLSPPVLSEWAVKGLRIEWGQEAVVDVAIDGQLTTIVPEPGSVLLLAPALLLAGVRLRKPRTR